MRTSILLVLCLSSLALGCSNTPSSSEQSDGGVTADGAATSCAPGATLGADDVLTESGVVRGAVTDAVRVWKGVPYAKPPIGDLRWKLPEKYGCFPNGLYDATSYGALCPQYGQDGGVVGNEDCLTLEVWQPTTPGAPATGRPVMVFIHGGGHEAGSATSTYLNGAKLAAAQGNIVVSLEYRLGPFGFMAHPALSAEGGMTKSGDYGMHDQIFALQWVKDNIVGFGGDPSKVLLFGESAGGESVCRIIASPLTPGLFQSAIIESGPCTAHTLDKAEQTGVTIATKVGCTDTTSTACLRGKSTAELMAGFAPLTNLSSQVLGLTFDGVIEGYAVPDLPRTTITSGNYHAVPTLVVSNANELSKGVPNIMTEAQFRAGVATFLGTAGTMAMVDKVTAQYASPANYPTWKQSYIQAISEGTIICAGRADALAMSQHGGKPTYRAIFGDVLDKATPAIAATGSFHGSELLWVFDSFDSAPGLNALVGDGDKKTVTAMQTSWSAFAATQTPTSAIVPAWPPYVPNSEQVIYFRDGAVVEADPFTANCEFWQALSAGSN